MQQTLKKTLFKEEKDISIIIVTIINTSYSTNICLISNMP